MFGSLNPVLVWFLVGLVFLLAELALPGFVIIFFGIGAWITALLLLLGLIKSFDSQLVIFLISSVASLIFFRKKGRSIFEGKTSGKLAPDQSLDDIKGEKAVVVEAVLPNKLRGKVEFHGTLWQAESDVPIEKGAVVEIVDRVNLTVKVKPL
jgi:membrane protein implicated in regulation of membrane protease activity